MRDILLVGFLVLLFLIAGLGYWSWESFKRVEEGIVLIHQPESNHLRLVLKVSQIANNLKAEARSALATTDLRLVNFSARQSIKALKDDMDRVIKDVQNTSIAQTEEWAEFVSAFNAYWAAISSGEAAEWYTERERMMSAIVALEDHVEKERVENDRRAQALSHATRNRMATATLAVLTVGIVVAGLTVYEIRRILSRLDGAYSEIRESRDYLQSLLDSLVSGLVVVGNDGALKTISESFRTVTALDGDIKSGENYKELLSGHPALVDRISEELEKHSQVTRYCGREELGGGRLFDVFASPLQIADEYRGVILVFVDVTETARAQAELRRNRALSAVGQMTAQIAHEIKNPLGSIRFAAEVLKRQPSTNGDADLETIQVIERSVDHLAAIVAELSEFARPKELKRAEINLNKFLDDLLPMVADRLSARQVKVEKDYDPDLPEGRFDTTELRKLFLNLIINSTDASGPDSTIILKTRRSGQSAVTVEVIDEGSGMDAETLRRLFEPFYTTKEKGTGLGMAIAKKIAELHGGDLAVASKKGEGTRVTVKLPLV